MNKIVITIDGPSAAGKTTLGRSIARCLGLLHINSGAVYRAVAYKALSSGTMLNDGMALVHIAQVSSFGFTNESGHSHFSLDGRDITTELRTSEITRAAMQIAKIATVREIIASRLREILRAGGVVIDGRATGSSICPDAQIKIFLDASFDIRALRRWKDEIKAGRNATIDEIRSQMRELDDSDRNRAVDPLFRSEDSILIDTSDLTIDEVVEVALSLIRQRYVF